MEDTHALFHCQSRAGAWMCVRVGMQGLGLASDG